jgi:patatin-related protein
MKEKELRVALVCFGGVSLAVYMHGICREILKLVRASSVLHGITDRDMRAHAAFLDHVATPDAEYDSEAIYFELLRELGRHIELRVVVDVIAGASAGGINGTMLARALSHDLSMRPLRDLWLDNADVSELLAPEARAGRWSKWILRPLIWGLGRTGYMPAAQDAEVRAKLSLFVRSRWFKPPLSGPRMTALMYDAIVAMGEAANPTASLLPSGQKLDLFVTLTDHWGYQQTLQIHDPPLIHEREHRHVLHFAMQRRTNGEIDSDFASVNAPALAFAARATSSFPGAFPPAQISEIDDVVRERGATWPGRDQFIAGNFERYAQLNADPSTASFVDGSVLNNRPFREAISAIRGRPAYREVDRRLVYIDPDPAANAVTAHHGVPGFFTTLKGALSDIPSSEPVIDEIAWVARFNDRVRRIRAIVEEARPRVSRLVGDVLSGVLDRPIVADEVRTWRRQVHERVRWDAGFAYEAYVRLKLASVRDFVSNVITGLRGAPPRSPMARTIAEIIDAWAIESHSVFQADGDYDPALESKSVDLGEPAWVRFLLAFDVDYRRRRLHFLIEGQNRLYQGLGLGQFEGFDRSAVDRLKRSFYERLDDLNRRERPSFFSAETRAMVMKLFASAPSIHDARDLRRHAELFVGFNRDKIDALIAQLAAEIDLDAGTDDIDHLLAATDPARWHTAARHEVLVNYLGFPFWDVLTFPVMTWREAGEFNEILIDRISPQDARTLNAFSGVGSLMGIGFGHFAAFFSRAYREKDYLLGRLHGLDRLIDIVCDAAELDPEAGEIDVVALKKKAFTCILDAEEKHLPNSAALLAALRTAVARLERAPPHKGADNQE